MKKIIMMGAREDEKAFAEQWAKDHKIDLTISSEVLDNSTYHLLEGQDGISMQQTMSIPTEMYGRLKNDGFTQIAQRSAGFDMHDLDEAKKQGIIITNVPAYSPNSVAEYTVGSALNLLRHTQKIQKRVTNHIFTWDKQILAKEVRSLKIGILGTGRIGQMTAEIFKGFGAELIGYDSYQSEEAKKILTYVDDLDEFLAQSDLVTIHMPLTKDNHHFFNKETFAKMKPGAFLINAARGGVIDTQALIDALESNQLSACAIDTYENEMPYVTKDWSGKKLEDPILEQLIQREDVLYTPHIAFYTETAVENLVFGSLDACLSVLNTGTADTIVNP
ncbi:D-2-hydroxyacid dehydrogenase [Isobaculum melis]|uniref:D-lactate dehydrogenase n=1 Tax=Isobaculum melis TaxID=142588 RepID=A0A1H9TJ85_9LACT|nr:D-2-hydroxyacid dehydrogenase [Isobaculum melis]SER97285.1 D-lactate dehydrogenase [Isobaculum melis]